MVAPPKPRRITLSEATDTYLDAVNAQVAIGALSPATRDNYAADLTEFVTHIGTSTITDDITGADVDAALAAYGDAPDHRFTDPTTKDSRGRSESTLARYRQSIHRFFTHAEKHAWVQMSPMGWSELRPRTPTRGELREARTSLDAEQALALLTHGPGSPQAEGRSHERNYARDRYLLALLMLTGPRVSEVCAANTTDMTVRDGIVMWRIVGKGRKVRHIPLSPWLVQTRDDYYATRTDLDDPTTDRPMLLTGRGNRITPRDVQRLLERAHTRVATADPQHARRATPHAMRHTAASLLLANGWDVKVVGMLLGHASLATTGQYLDELPGELASAVANHPVALRAVQATNDEMTLANVS